MEEMGKMKIEGLRYLNEIDLSSFNIATLFGTSSKVVNGKLNFARYKEVKNNAN